MADDAVDLAGEEAADGGYSRASSSCAPSGLLSGLAECDSCSEDEQPLEEFLQDEQELADTTARQHEEDGRDMQGIPWGRLQVSRDLYRQQRLQQYRNYMNCIPEEDWDAVRRELVAPWRQPSPLPPLCCPYRFVRNWRGVSSSIVHFQLRNLLWAASAHDVYVVYDNRVQHWNSVTRRVEDVLDMRGAPKGPRLPGLGRVQVSTLCVSGELMAAGGFTGELVLGRLARSEPGACWGDEDSDYDDDEEEDLDKQQDDKQQDRGAGGSSSMGCQAAGSSAAAAAAVHHQQQPQQQQRWTSACQELPLWTAAGSSSSRIGQGGQSWQAVELLRAASNQHAAATQRYVWGWEHHWVGLQAQQQQQQCSWQQESSYCHQQQPWQQRRGCRQQQQQQQQQQHEWPPLVRLRHEPGSPQQQEQQQCVQDCMQRQHQHHQQQQQLRRQQQHDEHEVLMGADGPAACEVLHSCRVTQSENGITNGIEVFNSCSYGCCVMTSNNDCCVRLFDVEGMRPRQRLEFPFAANYATLRPEGAALGGGPVVAVVGDDPLTWLVDCRSGLEVMKLEGHRDFSFAVVWHPGGQLLATGNQDSTTRVWDIRQPSSPLAVLGGSMGAIRALRFSPDGACLAAAEPADFVHVYDVASGFSKVQEIDLFGEVAGISFSPDAQVLFVAISDSMYSSLLQYQRAPPHCA